MLLALAGMAQSHSPTSSRSLRAMKLIPVQAPRQHTLEKGVPVGALPPTLCIQNRACSSRGLKKGAAASLAAVSANAHIGLQHPVWVDA